MARIKSSAIVAVALAGMLSGPVSAQRWKTVNPTLNSVNQPVVQRTDYVLDLPASGDGLPEPELVRLSHWLDSMRLRYGDQIWLDESQGYSDGGARRQIEEVVADYGILLSEGAPITAGAIQPGSLRVVVSRSVAFVPGCPNWGDAGEIGLRVTTGSNYGCATNSNLAAMIADPNDLVLGREGARGGDAAEATKSIKSYRNRVQTGFEGKLKTETTGGK